MEKMSEFHQITRCEVMRKLDAKMKAENVRHNKPHGSKDSHISDSKVVPNLDLKHDDLPIILYFNCSIIYTVWYAI